jgi:hypothetical protein
VCISWILNTAFMKLEYYTLYTNQRKCYTHLLYEKKLIRIPSTSYFNGLPWKFLLWKIFIYILISILWILFPTKNVAGPSRFSYISKYYFHCFNFKSSYDKVICSNPCSYRPIACEICKDTYWSYNIKFIMNHHIITVQLRIIYEQERE